MGRWKAALALAALSSAALSSAAGARAQSPGLMEQRRLEALASQIQAQQDLAARQAVIQQTQIQALDAQLRSQRALAEVAAQGASPRVAPLPPGAPALAGGIGGYASIPDAALAASDARVRAAADNRR